MQGNKFLSVYIDEDVLQKGSRRKVTGEIVVMEDNKIIDMYVERIENAIEETAKKYGGYCYTIANNILGNNEDAEESVNDTYFTAWNTIPPTRPSRLSIFLGKITRNLSLDRWRKRNAKKRGSGEVEAVLSELEECVGNGESVEEAYLQKEFMEKLNQLLVQLPETERNVFICRYWYLDSIADIAKRFEFSESKVTSMIHRTRLKLKSMLEKEGFV